MAYTAPAFRLDAFNCPHCGAFSRMLWDELWARQLGSYFGLYVAKCSHCAGISCWREVDADGDEDGQAVMIIPEGSIAPLPHPDMPSSAITDYLEARSIVNRSPRGAAALLRLAIQKLCVALGEQVEISIPISVPLCAKEWPSRYSRRWMLSG